MNMSTLRTLAAGLTVCLCLSGLSVSANAQFFTNDTTIEPDNGSYDLRISQQRFNQQGLNERYIRTNSPDGLKTYGRSPEGPCADGQCDYRRESDVSRGQSREGQSYGSAANFPSRSRLTTSWDPASQSIDPVTGLPSQRTRHHDRANGEGHRGHCRGGSCDTAKCDCPEGQCDCPIGSRANRHGQFRQQRLDEPSRPVGYDDFNMTRRNTAVPQYLPTRSRYSD